MRSRAAAEQVGHEDEEGELGHLRRLEGEGPEPQPPGRPADVDAHARDLDGHQQDERRHHEGPRQAGPPAVVPEGGDDHGHGAHRHPRRLLLEEHPGPAVAAQGLHRRGREHHHQAHHDEQGGDGGQQHPPRLPGPGQVQLGCGRRRGLRGGRVRVAGPGAGGGPGPAGRRRAFLGPEVGRRAMGGARTWVRAARTPMGLGALGLENGERAEATGRARERPRVSALPAHAPGFWRKCDIPCRFSSRRVALARPWSPIDRRTDGPRAERDGGRAARRRRTGGQGTGRDRWKAARRPIGCPPAG